MQGPREIDRKGEPFFDVAHNPCQRFIIDSNEANVEVLARSYRVKTFTCQSAGQGALFEGKDVLTCTSSTTECEALSVSLSKGQFGYKDPQKRTIIWDDLAVENYPAWKNRSFEFADLSLQQISGQHNRLSETECSYSNEQILNFLLRDSFSQQSLKKTMDVIAFPLDIESENDDKSVCWVCKYSTEPINLNP